MHTHAAQVDFMPVYAAHLRSIIQKGISHPSNYERPLEGFHVIVDAGASWPCALDRLATWAFGHVTIL